MVKITDPEERADLNEAWAMVLLMVFCWAGLVASLWLWSSLVVALWAITATMRTYSVLVDTRNLTQGVGPVYWFVGDNTWSKAPVAIRYCQLREMGYPFRRGKGLGVLIRNTEVQVGFCRRRTGDTSSTLHQLDGRELTVPVNLIADWNGGDSAERSMGYLPAPKIPDAITVQLGLVPPTDPQYDFLRREPLIEIEDDV